jgi:hypothetical protein
MIMMRMSLRSLLNFCIFTVLLNPIESLGSDEATICYEMEYNLGQSRELRVKMGMGEDVDSDVERYHIDTYPTKDYIERKQSEVGKAFDNFNNEFDKTQMQNKIKGKIGAAVN